MLSCEDEKPEDDARFCRSVLPLKDEGRSDSIDRCGERLESAMTGRPPGAARPKDPVPHTDKQIRAFENVVNAYARHTANDYSRMPGQIRGNMASALTYYSREVHEILGGQVDGGYPEQRVKVEQTSLRGFIRAVAEDSKSFHAVREAQMGYIAEDIQQLDRRILSVEPRGDTDEAREVVVEAGSVVGALTRIRAEALSGESSDKGSAESEAELSKDYEENGYPRLRNLIHERAREVGIPEGDISNSGGRLADITGWANAAYNAK